MSDVDMVHLGLRLYASAVAVPFGSQPTNRHPQLGVSGRTRIPKSRSGGTSKHPLRLFQMERKKERPTDRQTDRQIHREPGRHATNMPIPHTHDLRKIPPCPHRAFRPKTCIHV